MDYAKIMKYLKRIFGCCYSNTEFYSAIATWLNWYKGEVQSFHTEVIYNGINTTTRDLYKLKMAKRVCEDWTSALISEGIDIVLNGTKKTNAFVQGTKLNGGVLGSNNFNDLLSTTIERMFALGTSAIVLDVNGISTDNEGNVLGVSPTAEIKLRSYDATRIIPIKYDNNIITDVAFVSKVFIENREVIVLSIHTREEDGYVIYNKFLDDRGAEIAYNGVLPVIRTKSDKPLFSILRTNISNNIDMDSPMGVSIYADAIDTLKAIDLCYDACMHDIQTGRRIIMMNKKAACTTADGKLIPPQDARKNYMVFYGDEIVGEGSAMDKFFMAFSPKLNTENLDNELQNQLNMLSNKVSLGTRFYNFNLSTGVTATEYVGERNDFIRNSNKLKESLKNTIKGLVLGVLYIGNHYFNKSLGEDVKVDILISDGIVESDDAKRNQDRQDVKDGLMSKVEYRVKWYGETEEEAVNALENIRTSAT